MTTIVAALLIAAGALSAALMGSALIGGESVTAVRLWRRYANWADSQARLLFLHWTPADFALRHLGFAVGATCLGAWLAGWAAAVAGFWVVALLGFLWPARELRKRSQRLEAQLDPTLRSIAQTLRVTANLTDALETVAARIDPPMSEEIGLCLRQVRLGLPIEEALRQMGQRTGSRSIDTATTAIVIGRMTGGNLPSLLEEIATTLRERVRLDGMVETKTAEGKAQAWVMGLMPPALGIMLWHLDADLIAPLLSDPAGWVILTVVGVLEIVGIMWVRRVTAIEA